MLFLLLHSACLCLYTRWPSSRPPGVSGALACTWAVCGSEEAQLGAGPCAAPASLPLGSAAQTRIFQAVGSVRNESSYGCVQLPIFPVAVGDTAMSPSPFHGLPALPPEKAGSPQSPWLSRVWVWAWGVGAPWRAGMKQQLSNEYLLAGSGCQDCAKRKLEENGIEASKQLRPSGMEASCGPRGLPVGGAGAAAQLTALVREEMRGARHSHCRRDPSRHFCSFTLTCCHGEREVSSEFSQDKHPRIPSVPDAEQCWEPLPAPTLFSHHTTVQG